MPIKDVLQAVPTLELGRNFASALLQRFTKRSGKRHRSLLSEKATLEGPTASA
jgi:hypothetical protein